MSVQADPRKPLPPDPDSTAGKMRPAILAASGAAFAAATVVGSYVGYLAMFTGFHNYDDEGFMLVALRSFASGQALYDKVHVQYGPFFFEFFGLFAAAGVPFDNDSGRLVTLAVWLAIALLAGVSAFVFTRNLAVGLCTHLVTFAGGYAFTGEPMHPGGLVVLLVIGVAGVALIGATRWSGRWFWAITGALVAAAVLTKVNVGVFAAASVLFACAITFPALARHWPVRLLAASCFVAVPFVIMKSDLDQGWAERYAVDVAVSALALVVVTSASRPEAGRRLRDLGWMAAGGGGLAIVSIAGALALGTSPHGLLQGLILYPLDQQGAYAAPLDLPNTTLAWDGIGLACAFAWVAYRSLARRPEVRLEGAVRVAVGLVIWTTMLGGIHVPGVVEVSALNTPLVLPLAFSWVAAAPLGRADGFRNLDYARALIPALAVLQALHAFPVPGSQTVWAALPLGLVGAVCVGDGLSQLAPVGVRLQLASAAIFALLVVSWLPPALNEARAAYAASVPLGLPGATRIRVPAAQAAMLRDVNQAIRDNCDTFLSIPGLDSFYIFGQMSPPSPPTRFIWLAGDFEAQRMVVADSAGIKRLCVVENSSLIQAWSRGRQVPIGPLEAYIEAGFVPAYTIGDYTILTRR